MEFSQTINYAFYYNFHYNVSIAYFSHWQEHTFAGIVGCLIIFLAMYVAIWIIQYSVWKHRIKQINDKLENK
ncbi:DUF3021 domain-containing protein [Clostridium sp. HV4-5-A1G]|nr:DUF3021 domain-containing protein [Clostridium sp. HV4-5-A1G]